MTRRELQNAIEAARAQLDYINHIFATQWQGIEDRDEIQKWLNRLRRQREILRRLESETPDDE